MAVLDHVPEGWKVVGGCTNAPAEYRFINNNKGRHVHEDIGAMGGSSGGDDGGEMEE